MSEPFIGEVRAFGFTFAPRGWADCDGQLLPISSNTALFSLLGVMYGGDGETNFALPNLQGRAPLHQGAGPGLTSRSVGSTGGARAVTLTQGQVPLHDHDLVAGEGRDPRPRNRPGGKIWADSTHDAYATTTDPLVTMGNVALSSAGGGDPHNNMPPYLVVRYCIALVGRFPSES